MCKDRSSQKTNEVGTSNGVHSIKKKYGTFNNCLSAEVDGSLLSIDEMAYFKMNRDLSWEKYKT